MTRHASHTSPHWPASPKPRAIAPRTPHDYSLLAATVACPLPRTVSRLMGFEEDYADRLLGSAPGRAFADWLSRQPEEFVTRFKPDSLADLESVAEDALTDPGQQAHRESAEEAHAATGFTAPKRTD